MIRTVKRVLLTLGFLTGILYTLTASAGTQNCYGWTGDYLKNITNQSSNDQPALGLEGSDKEGKKDTEKAHEDTLTFDDDGVDMDDTLVFDDDGVDMDDTLVYDDFRKVDDTLVYEDFETPKKGDGKSSGGQFKRIPEKDGKDLEIHGSSKSATPSDNPQEKGQNGRESGTLPVEINLYPNPAAPGSTIHVDMRGLSYGQILVRDLSGKLVRSIEINAGKADISGLASGTYLVTVTDGRSIHVARAIVQ